MEAIISYLGKNSESYQEIPQSQTADKPMAREEEPHNNQETPGRQTEQPALFSPSKIATVNGASQPTHLHLVVSMSV